MKYFDRQKRMDFIVQTTPEFGPEFRCEACGGGGSREVTDSWDPMLLGSQESCALCQGTGKRRNRLTIMQREALAIHLHGLPMEGMLYPTITPGELEKLR